MRSAIGPSESASLNSPSVGRPKCDVTSTAAPAFIAVCTAGTDARIRVSSVIFPASSCGTLRSARMKTRLPARFTSAILSTFMRNAELQLLGDYTGHFQHLAGIAPFVVVPGNDFNECTVERNA